MMFRWSTFRWKHPKVGSYEMIGLAIIVLAIILRVVLVTLNVPETNSDEGTMGLEAMHIAFRGEHPVFLYGQDYMGVLEAYIAAVFFRLLGVSVFTLRIGMVVMFALFMVSMYFLTSLLYTKRLTLLTLVLLGFGIASDVLIQQLRAVGGAIETLLFGSIVILLATWLALKSGQILAPRTQRLRLFVYGCWGLVAGLGIWVHLLVVPFVLGGSLILVFFCYRELLSWAFVLLLLGLLIGAFPFILYNLHTPLAHDTIFVTLHLDSSTELARQFSQHLLRKRLIGTTLWSLPIATGLTPVCALSDLPYFGSPTARTLPCIIVQGAWSLGYLALFTMASLMAMGALWKLMFLRRVRACSWSQKDRQAMVIHFARLMILFAAGITLLLYISSPLSGLKPWSTRYLVGLLIAVPTVLWPLWSGFDKLRLNSRLSAKFLMGCKQGILILISLTILAGTVVMFASLPSSEANYQQQEALVQDLLRIGATRVYVEYWTGYRLMFQSQEHIICAIPRGLIELDPERYLPYIRIVSADPHAVSLFPANSPDAINFEKRIEHSRQQYQRFVFDGYVAYRPE